MKLLLLWGITFILSITSFATEPIFTISDHVKRVLPSIVKIKVQQTVPINDESELTSADSGGSGFVLDSEHHVVTNAHVVADGKKIVIIDNHNIEYPATLIAKDEKTDIAILNVPTFNAPVLSEINTSSSAGDGVFAIGSPYSLGHSVSLGVISAVERFLPNYPYIHFIQTDAAINPGNSGGALFNLNGELIGMTSTYFSKQGGYTNIAFAIPITDVHRVSERLLNQKKIERGYMGAELLLSERISRKLGYPSSVFISRIEPNSPAEVAGLKIGDIITAFNRNSINDGGELHRFLESSSPEDTITLSLIRDKQQKIVVIKLGTIPLEKKEITNISSADASEKNGLILKETSSGIEVLLSYAMAKTVGIDPKDIITQINGTPVKTIQELNTQLSKLKETEIAQITIKRNTNIITLPIGSKAAIKGYVSRN
jgi:serine protease Do